MPLLWRVVFPRIINGLTSLLLLFVFEHFVYIHEQCLVVTREWNDEWMDYLKSHVTTFKFLNCKSYQASKLDKLYLVAMLAKTIVWLSNVNVYWKPLTTNKDGNAPNEKVYMSIRMSYTVIGKQKTLCQYSLEQQICLQKTNLYMCNDVPIIKL